MTDTTTTPATEAPAEEAKVKKAPVPEGFVTPVQFGHILTAQLREAGTLTEHDEIKPQIVYGWVKNGKDFPVEKHPIDGRPILVASKGLEWFAALQARKANSNAKKAAAAAVAAAAPSVDAGDTIPEQGNKGNKDNRGK